MFSLFKKKPIELASPIQGKAIALSEVNDPTFAQEMVGKGAAVKPTVGEVLAPCDGVVTIVFPTLHAIALKSDQGAEILIHVGLDTVNLNGEGFTAHVQVDQRVEKGQKLLSFDLAKLEALGYDTVVPVVVCNPNDFKSVKMAQPASSQAGAPLILLEVAK